MALRIIHFVVLLLTSDLLVVHGQSEWVWGKSSGSGKPVGQGQSQSQNSGTSSGNSGFLNPSSYYYNTNGQPNNNNNNYIGSSSNNNGLVPVNTVTIFGSGSGSLQNSGGSASASGDKFFASQSQQSIPVSANQPIIVQVLQPGSTGSSTDSKNNDVIPSNSIRSGVTPVNGEPRLFLSRVRTRLHKALKSLVNNNGGGGGGLGGLGGGGGGLGNLNSIIQSSSGGGGGLNGLGGLSGLSGLGGGGGGGGSGILNTLQQIGPLLSQGLGNRLPTVGPLPVSNSEFNTQGTSGSSSSSSGPSSSNGNGNGNGISFNNNGQSCSCVSSDSCRLPNVDKGTCSGGIMCCRATGTRIISESNDNNRGSSNSDNTRSPSNRLRVADLRTGLLAEIVRGTSTVFDDALDLLLAPFLNQDDQQRLANRIASSGNRKGSKK